MKSKKTNYIFESVLIAIIALDTFTPYLDQNFTNLEKQFTLLNFRIFDSFFVTSKIYFFSPTVKQEILLLLNLINKKSTKKLKNNEFEKQKIKQYLRRFSFLYKSFILKRYPNDFSDLTVHKINILAIKNLYILNNLGI